MTVWVIYSLSTIHVTVNFAHWVLLTSLWILLIEYYSRQWEFCLLSTNHGTVNFAHWVLLTELWVLLTLVLLTTLWNLLTEYYSGNCGFCSLRKLLTALWILLTLEYYSRNCGFCSLSTTHGTVSCGHWVLFKGSDIHDTVGFSRWVLLTTQWVLLAEYYSRNCEFCSLSTIQR